MNSVSFLIKLSETEKRFILAFICLILFLLAIFVLIVLLIAYISKKQSYKIDALMHDVVITGVIDNKKKFLKVSKKKNAIYFYKKSFIPFFISIISLCILFIYAAACKTSFSSLFTDHSPDGFGFATCLYIYDFTKIVFTETIFGMLPKEITPLSSPHFSLNALTSIIFIITFIFGGCWYLINVQAYIARRIRARKLATSIYEKRLDNIKFDNLTNFKYNSGNITYVNQSNINSENKNESSNSKDSSNNITN